jgi:hypothetical protein
MEICPMKAVLIKADRTDREGTDMTKQIGVFCSYVRALKNNYHKEK